MCLSSAGAHMCLSSVGAHMFVCVQVSYVSVYRSLLKGGYTFMIFVCMYRELCDYMYIYMYTCKNIRIHMHMYICAIIAKMCACACMCVCACGCARTIVNSVGNMKLHF